MAGPDFLDFFCLIILISFFSEREEEEEETEDSKKDQDGTLLPLPATARDAAAGDFPENR